MTNLENIFILKCYVYAWHFILEQFVFAVRVANCVSQCYTCTKK